MSKKIYDIRVVDEALAKLIKAHPNAMIQVVFPTYQNLTERKLKW